MQRPGNPSTMTSTVSIYSFNHISVALNEWMDGKMDRWNEDVIDG